MSLEYIMGYLSEEIRGEFSDMTMTAVSSEGRGKGKCAGWMWGFFSKALREIREKLARWRWVPVFLTRTDVMKTVKVMSGFSNTVYKGKIRLHSPPAQHTQKLKQTEAKTSLPWKAVRESCVSNAHRLVCLCHSPRSFTAQPLALGCRLKPKKCVIYEFLLLCSVEPVCLLSLRDGSNHNRFLHQNSGMAASIQSELNTC